MGEISREQFNEYLDGPRWPQVVREIMRSLLAVAQSAGADVTVRAHESAAGAVGLTFKRGRKAFLRADPKPVKEHVCVSIPGASDADLGKAGRVHSRKNNKPSWVDVTVLDGVEVLESEISSSYLRADD